VPPAGFNQVNQSEWYNACTNGKQGQKFPYGTGTSYAPALCNDLTAGHKATVPVGSLPDCSNDADVTDLSGNVWEWEFGFDQDDQCYARGGSFRSGEAFVLDCESKKVIDCEAVSDEVGFRCCSG